MFTFALLPFLLCAAVANATTNATHKRCRTQPGDPLFPSAQQLSAFNSSIHGRLIPVVPSAQFCRQREGGCTDAEWTDSIFRSNIPGAMLSVNWEQDFTSIPPSLCFRNTIVCGQGSVPIYAVNATSAAHIQAGVRFAQAHNLKIAIKASGHDFLGRSTAKSSLLLWTRYLENITFHNNFLVEGEDKGSAMTVGSGVGLRTIYQAAKTQGKVFVGGRAGNVVAAGGYLQGAGHSALSPLYGLAADNALEFEIALANGDLVTVNKVSHADLFWALRGGGAGSWGVIISATFRTFPTFDVVEHTFAINVNSSSAAAQLGSIHAQHIFDWDHLRAGQYLSILPTPPSSIWNFTTFFPSSSISAANVSMKPFIDAVTSHGFSITNVSFQLLNVNDALSPTASDAGGFDGAMGSRLIPADVYRHDPAAVGETYKKLLAAGETIWGNLVAGGQVSANSHINSAVNPKWRTAKSHIFILVLWDDDTPPEAVELIRQDLTKNKVPILEKLAGPGSGSYTNEGDLREPDFKTTFFGSNYVRLREIKRIYDPTELFIVGAGVASENWDVDGLCRIS